MCSLVLIVFLPWWCWTPQQNTSESSLHHHFLVMNALNAWMLFFLLLLLRHVNSFIDTVILRSYTAHSFRQHASLYYCHFFIRFYLLKCCHSEEMVLSSAFTFLLTMTLFSSRHAWDKCWQVAPTPLCDIVWLTVNWLCDSAENLLFSGSLPYLKYCFHLKFCITFFSVNVLTPTSHLLRWWHYSFLVASDQPLPVSFNR